MTETPEQKVGLVTGGSRGIGRAITEALLGGDSDDGDWKVYFCSKDDESVATALAALEERFSGRVFGRVCDVGSQDEVDGLVEWVSNQAGRIDLLVNNAGIGHFGPVDQIDGDDWRRVVRINLNGAFYAIHAVAPIMKQQGSGWIINIASIAAKNPFAGGAVYNASKFGLLGLSEASMLDLRPHGIRVSAIMPGSVATEFSHPKPGSSDDWKIAPEDIARTVMDLLRYPDRTLPSRIEIRPTQPPTK